MLTIDGLEAIRLADQEGLYQEEAGVAHGAASTNTSTATSTTLTVRR